MAYLLVVPYEDKVLAGPAECGDGVGFQNFCCLLHDHQAGAHLLQGLPVLGRPRGCHADDLSLAQHTDVLTHTDLSQTLSRILVGLLGLQGPRAEFRPVPEDP